MRYTLCVTFFYVAAYGFIAGSPFVYIDYYGIAPQYYGWLFAVNIVGVMALSFVNRILVRHCSLASLLKVSTLISTAACLFLTISIKAEFSNIYVTVASVFFFFAMNGAIAASATAAALDKIEPQVAGSASAVIGSLQYGSGIISTLLLTLFSDGTPWTMSWIMLLFTFASAVTVLSKPKNKRIDVCRNRQVI